MVEGGGKELCAAVVFGVSPAFTRPLLISGTQLLLVKTSVLRNQRRGVPQGAHTGPLRFYPLSLPSSPSSPLLKQPTLNPVACSYEWM